MVTYGVANVNTAEYIILPRRRVPIHVQQGLQYVCVYSHECTRTAHDITVPRYGTVVANEHYCQV